MARMKMRFFVLANAGGRYIYVPEYLSHAECRRLPDNELTVRVEIPDIGLTTYSNVTEIWIAKDIIPLDVRLRCLLTDPTVREQYMQRVYP